MLTAAGLLLIVATLLPIVRKDSWWIRVFDFPRVQIAAASAVVLIADLFLRGGSGLLVAMFHATLLCSIVYQSYMMYPYTFLARKPVEKARAVNRDSTLALLLANVLIDNRNAGLLRDIIRQVDPDIILIVEADGWWQKALRELERTHPFAVQQPQDNSYGMILYSKLKLLAAEVMFRVEPDVPSIRARVQLRGGTEVELHCLHPKPPAPQESKRSTERDAELLMVGRETRGKDIPTVVLGDLNDVAWSRTTYLFHRISGLLDPRTGRGLYNSFHAMYPFLRFPLDHFFHSNHFRLVELRRLACFGSDHFPMYIALSYEPEAPGEQEKPRAGDAEQREATEKIQQGVAQAGNTGADVRSGENAAAVGRVECSRA